MSEMSRRDVFDLSAPDHEQEDQILCSRLSERSRIVLDCRSCEARMNRTVRLLARIRTEYVVAVGPVDFTPRKSALSLMPVAQKMMFLPFARSSAKNTRPRSASCPSATRLLRSFSSRGHITHCMSPPRHLMPAAASTASGDPPIPK